MFQTNAPFGGTDTWPPEILNYALGELRREYPSTPPERIVRGVDFAARCIPPPMGRVRLLQKAREALKADG